MDAAGGQRRDDAGGVAGQDHAVAREWHGGAAARDQAGARGGGLRQFGQAGAGAYMGEQAVEIRRAAVAGQVAQRQAGLDAGGVLCDPAYVAGGKAAGDEAMEHGGVWQGQPWEFVFDAIQEIVRVAEACALRHA
ncbi:hypothetical protein D3C81_1638050 [compost metagenome]